MPPLGWYQTKGIDKSGDGYLFRTESSKQEFTDAQKAEYAEQRELEKHQREVNRKLKLVEFFSQKLTATQRDPILRNRIGELTDVHRQSLRDRGLTDEQIDVHQFYSGNYSGDQNKGLGKSALWWGIFVPTIDVNGMMTGWQFTPDGRGQTINGESIPKYVWGKDQSLPIGEGELPLQVYNAQASQASRSIIWAMEGTLKPLVAANLHKISVVGAAGGNFAASPQQFAEAISEYTQLNVAIDAGDAINPQRVTHWKRQAEYFGTLGINIKWMWWGQETKASNDIDEMSADEYKKIKSFDTEEFLQLLDGIAAKAKHLEIYKGLATLQSAPTLKYDDDWVRVPKFKPGSITLVSSGVGTGKTEALGKMVDNHLKVHPDAKVIIVTHRVILGKALAVRLDSDYIADLKHGIENYASINASNSIVLCVDSLHHLDLRDLPEYSIVVLDECEAILAHTASGGTLGDRTAPIQAKFVELLRSVIAKGGQIVGAEDSITQISVDTLKYICPDVKPDILVNTRHKFNYSVQIDGHTDQRDFIGMILDRLANKQRLAIPTTSQKFGHSLHKVLLWAFPTLRIVRIDSRTTTEHGDFMADPAKWLEDNHIDVLIYSPAIESGVSIVDSIADKPFFDAMFMYVANLNVRSQIQLLHRYRGNCPRYIFSPKRLASAQGSVHAGANYRLARQTAVEEMLRHGHTIKDSEVGGIFNCLEAKLKSRDALSATYNREILVADLESRNHKVEIVKWADERAQYQSEHLGKYWPKATIGEAVKECKAKIIEEDATAMATADCTNLTTSQAHNTLQCSVTPFDLKWGAKKRINQDLLPDFNVDDIEHCKFLLDNKRKKKVDARCFMLNPALAKAVAGIKIEYQQASTHVLHYRVPTDEALALLLQPIVPYIMELAHSDGFTSEHPAAIKVAEYAIANSYTFYRLKRLQFKAPKQDRLGNTHHSYVTSANKILRMLGWDAVLTSKANGDRTYKVENAVDPISDAYIHSRNLKQTEYETKHRELINRRRVDDSAISSIDCDTSGSYDVDDDDIGDDREDPLIAIKMMMKNLRKLSGDEYQTYELQCLNYASINNLEFIKPESRTGFSFGYWQAAA